MGGGPSQRASASASAGGLERRVEMARPDVAPRRARQRDRAQRRRRFGRDRERADREAARQLAHRRQAALQAARHALVPEHRIAALLEQIDHLAVARRDLVEAAAVEGDVAAHDAGEGEVVARHLDVRIDDEAPQRLLVAAGGDVRDRFVDAGAPGQARLAQARERGRRGGAGLAHRRPVPARPRGEAAHVEQVGRAALRLGGKLVEQAQHRRDADGGDDRRAGVAQRLFGLAPVAGADEKADPAQHVGLAGGGAPVQRRQLVGHLAAQPVAQEIAEQVVQAQRRLAALQHRDEQAAPLDLLEPLGGARIGADRGAARRR